MKKCPRCHTSMLLDFEDITEGGERLWKCLGCGRETFENNGRQEQDESLLNRIKSLEGRVTRA